MTFRSDYVPSETFCCICGLPIKEHQIAAEIQGTIIHRLKPDIEAIDPCDLYLCREHATLIDENVKGGIEAARRRQREQNKLDREDQSAVGK